MCEKGVWLEFDRQIEKLLVAFVSFGPRHRFPPLCNDQHQVAVTDGLYRSGDSDNELTMGAGVVWEQTNADTISVKIDGPFSSTWPELAAAIAMALQQSSATKTLILLVESATALQRLRWLHSDDFRPLQHKMRDLDIINDILEQLQSRQEKYLETILVKVFGHSGVEY